MPLRVEEVPAKRSSVEEKHSQRKMRCASQDKTIESSHNEKIETVPQYQYQYHQLVFEHSKY